MRKFRSIPPAGSPITPSDIFHGVGAILSARNPHQEFCDEVCRFFGVKHSFLLSSGKASLAVLLHALMRISDRREVIIPAFSSFCLPSAVAKFGLKIVLCDNSIETLDFDLDHLERLICQQTLCVIPVHLFGYSAQMDVICDMARAKGSYVIEDAAQAAGGTLTGKKLGTIGDVGVFSLGRGKNITVGAGGILVTNSDVLANEISKSCNLLSIAKQSVLRSVHDIFRVSALAMFLRPWLYWMPEKLPFLNLGASEFSTDFDCGGLSKYQAGLGILVLQRLDEYNQMRRNNAFHLVEQLADFEGITFPMAIPDSYPVYLRLVVLVENPNVRNRIFQSLQDLGLGVSKTYPSALHYIKDIESYTTKREASYPNAEVIGNRILTLPTHPYVSSHDRAHVGKVFQSILNQKKPRMTEKNLDRQLLRSPV